MNTLSDVNNVVEHVDAVLHDIERAQTVDTQVFEPALNQCIAVCSTTKTRPGLTGMLKRFR